MGRRGAVLELRACLSSIYSRQARRLPIKIPMSGSKRGYGQVRVLLTRPGTAQAKRKRPGKTTQLRNEVQGAAGGITAVVGAVTASLGYWYACSSIVFTTPLNPG